MQLFYEIFPVFLFFIAFKMYDIYVATVVGIVTTFLQVIFTRVGKGNWDKKQIITFFVFILFGSMTLYFHNPIFVKWKPTVIFWIFALLILITQFFTKKPLTQRLLEEMLQGKNMIPLTVWKKLNTIWAIFFMMMGAINLYVAYNYSNNAWVNFKFYGISSALIVLSIFQAIYLIRFFPPDKKSQEN